MQSLIVLGEYFCNADSSASSSQMFFKLSYSSFPVIHKSWPMLSFLYCLVVKGKLISAKKLPPMGIEPATLGP